MVTKTRYSQRQKKRRSLLPLPHLYLENTFGRNNAERIVEFPSLFHVQDFIYDGLTVRTFRTYAKWEIVNFLCWTPDRGLGTFQCSDGIARYIPTCCLNPVYYFSLPEEPDLSPMEGIGVLIGTPSTSY